MNNHTSPHTSCEHELLYNHETIGTWEINGNLLDFMCPQPLLSGGQGLGSREAYACVQVLSYSYPAQATAVC